MTTLCPSVTGAAWSLTYWSMLAWNIRRWSHRVRGNDGSFVAQVDLAYPGHRVAVELDSARWHDNRESFVHDRRRRNEITLAGWTVLNFTWSDYVDHPAALCEAVAGALATARSNKCQ